MVYTETEWAMVAGALWFYATTMEESKSWYTAAAFYGLHEKAALQFGDEELARHSRNAIKKILIKGRP